MAKDKAAETRGIFEEALAECEAGGNAENYCVVLLEETNKAIGASLNMTGKMTTLSIDCALADTALRLLHEMPGPEKRRKTLAAYMEHTLARLGDAVGKERAGKEGQ